MKRLAILAAVSLLTGCVAPPPPVTESVYPIYMSFDEEQAKRMVERGTNTIKGSAFARQRGGGVVTCAGNEVRLIPATDYATVRIRALYGDHRRGFRFDRTPVRFEPDVPAFSQHQRVTRCDAQGNFQFDQVADGDFFVQTFVAWRVGYEAQGGAMMERVSARNGQITNVMLTM